MNAEMNSDQLLIVVVIVCLHNELMQMRVKVCQPSAPSQDGWLKNKTRLPLLAVIA